MGKMTDYNKLFINCNIVTTVHVKQTSTDLLQ